MKSYTDNNSPLTTKYHTNIYKQTESIDNFGSTKMVSIGRINSLLKSRNQSNDNINRTIKKQNQIQSIHTNSQIHFLYLSNLIEQSLKQIDEYRFKIKNSFIQQISNENNLTNSNINKSDEIKTLIGRYEITNSMNPTNNFQRINKSNEYISLNIFQYFDQYSKYLNHLLDQYINNDIYENFQSKISCLSLSEQIKDFFKKFSQRYRIIVQVYIQQNLDQSILIASRFLWDKTYDHFLQKKFKKNNIFLLIIIFFIYKE